MKYSTLFPGITISDRTPLIVIIASTVIVLAVSVFSIVQGWLTIFQNLFYFPIIISCVYYQKRGFVFSVILAGTYFAMMLAVTRDLATLEGALIRVIIFIVVAAVITYISVIRVRTEAALRDSEIKFREIFNSANDAIQVNEIDDQGVPGKFHDVNDVACRMLGYTKEELLERGPLDIVTGYHNRPVENIFEELKTRGQSFFETEHRRKDGTIVPVEVNAHVILIDGKRRVLSIVRDITERKMAEEALRQKSEELDRYFTSSLDLLCIANTRGEFIRVNPEWENVLGYTRQELEGRVFLDLVHPDDLEDTLEALSTLQDQEEVLGFENRYRCKDGSYRWIEWRSRPHGETIYAVARDITTRKMAEEALRETADRLGLATRAGNVGIWDWDVTNNRLIWDEQMYRLYGITADQFSGAYDAWQAGLHPDDKARGDREIRMALSGEKEFNTEFRVVWPDGSIHFIHALAMVQRDASGNPMQMIGTNWDITERKRAEDTVRKANRQLNLLGSITRHDINNKVMVILGYLRVAQKKYTEPGLKEYFDKMESASKQIGAQIAFTKVYQELGSHDPTWQDLDKALPRLDVPATVTLNAEVRGVEVFADPMFKKVFFNLLDNSIRHGERVSSIHVCTRQSGTGLTIVWEDNGVGIPPEEKERIFERGFGKNTGLGMFLVREILSLTDITITETGVQGTGARFEITVPMGMYRIHS